jgi:hypothetical protein
MAVFKGQSGPEAAAQTAAASLTGP